MARVARGRGANEHAYLATHCGCAGFHMPACALCGGQQVMDPNKNIPGFSSPVSCLELEFGFATGIMDCHDTQFPPQLLQNLEYACGCPPTPAPTKAPTNSSCEDLVDDWFDFGGFGCEWYSSNQSRCISTGDDFANQGYTANEVCCACGGGTGNA